MQYTTAERIARKLKARLSPNDATNNPVSVGYPTSTVTIGVDNELIIIVAEEEENWLNYILEEIYYFPLNNNHPILADIVESLVVAKLLLYNFQGQQLPPTDLASILKNEAFQKLNMLVAGFNIEIPGMPPRVSYPGTMPARRIILKGEIERPVSPARIIVNNEFLVGSRLKEEEKHNEEYNHKDYFGFITEL